MRKNQKYTQAEMYSAIERCHREGLSYLGYCKEVGMHYATFKYWVKKYQHVKYSATTESATFLPVKLAPQEKATNIPHGRITISYPGGLRVDCPADTPLAQLTALLKAR